MRKSNLDAMARANGFADIREVYQMVAAADLSTPLKREAFEKWKQEDGSKAGLLALAR